MLQKISGILVLTCFLVVGCVNITCADQKDVENLEPVSAGPVTTSDGAAMRQRKICDSTIFLL